MYEEKYDEFTYYQKENFFFDVGDNFGEIDWSKYFEVTFKNGETLDFERLYVSTNGTTFNSPGIKLIRIGLYDPLLKKNIYIQEFNIFVFDEGPIIYGAGPLILLKGAEFNPRFPQNPFGIPQDDSDLPGEASRFDFPQKGIQIHISNSGSLIEPFDQFEPRAYEVYEIGAIDKLDLDLTDQIEIIDEIDTNSIGYQTITYKVTDNDGNTTIVNRPVYITEEQHLSSGSVEENFYDDTLEIPLGTDPKLFDWGKYFYLTNVLNSDEKLPDTFLDIDYSLVDFNKLGEYTIVIRVSIYNTIGSHYLAFRYSKVKIV